MGQPVRMYICDENANCCPVKFPLDLLSTTIYVSSDDVNELVSAIHAADDDIPEDDDEE